MEEDAPSIKPADANKSGESLARVYPARSKLNGRSKMVKQREGKVVLPSVSWIVWLSSGLVIVLLVTCTTLVMATPANSSPQNLPAAEKPNTNQAELEKLIEKIYSRNRGYSNPDPDPDDNPDDGIPAVKPTPRRHRTRRPLQKIGMDFDLKQSYVIKHPNGTITFFFPETPSPTSETEATTPVPDSNSSTVADRKLNQEDFTCTPNFPSCFEEKRSDEENALIDNVVAKYASSYVGLFGDDTFEDGDLKLRFDTSDDIPFCVPRERLIHPQYGFTQDGRKLTIVNTPKYSQGVRVEICENPGDSCSELGGLFKTECKQIFYYRTLLAIDPDTGEPIKEQFKLPACCKCMKKKN